jgi:lysophospholipase L1-like esterase
MRRRLACAIALALMLTPALLSAQGNAPAAGQAEPGRGFRGRGGPALPANQPAPPFNEARHQGFLETARGGDIDLLFVGDSITDWFAHGFRDQPARGGAVWSAAFGSLKPANFGIAGDTTQGVLWRMQNGELEGFQAKLIVHMLGTNNINRNPVDEIVDGNRLILEEYRTRQPQARVLLLGVFPRGAEADNPLRATIAEINGKLAALADNRDVFFMDIGEAFLAADGTLTEEVMPDGLHPSEQGYRSWADAIAPRVRELMQ